MSRTRPARWRASSRRYTRMRVAIRRCASVRRAAFMPRSRPPVQSGRARSAVCTSSSSGLERRLLEETSSSRDRASCMSAHSWIGEQTNAVQLVGMRVRACDVDVGKPEIEVVETLARLRRPTAKAATPQGHVRFDCDMVDLLRSTKGINVPGLYYSLHTVVPFDGRTTGTSPTHLDPRGDDDEERSSCFRKRKADSRRTDEHRDHQNGRNDVPQVVVDAGDRDLDDAEQRPDDRRQCQNAPTQPRRQPPPRHISVVFRFTDVPT